MLDVGLECMLGIGDVRNARRSARARSRVRARGSGLWPGSALGLGVGVALGPRLEVGLRREVLSPTPMRNTLTPALPTAL